MITVVASLRIKPGKQDAFLRIFTALVPRVLQEEGCIEYYPTVDYDTGWPVQKMDEDRVTIIEKWHDPEALECHLKTPHLEVYQEQTEDMVEERIVKVLQNA